MQPSIVIQSASNPLGLFLSLVGSLDELRFTVYIFKHLQMAMGQKYPVPKKTVDHAALPWSAQEIIQDLSGNKNATGLEVIFSG